MRIFIIALLLGLSIDSIAQLKEGFDPEEVRACIAMCNSYTFQDLYDSDTDILPEEYHKIFTSEVVGLDNRFQVYVKDEVAVINFRGSTSKLASWVENMYSAMIPAQGIMNIDDEDFSYKFAENTSAAIHSGYALAVVLLGPNLFEQIHKLNEKGIYNIILTGHSQGGSLANLSRAYLENLSEGEISSKNIFKTYAFANPMCGNQEFSKEYQTRFCDTKMSYSIINPDDLVPQMPMHYQEESLFSVQLIKKWIAGKESVDIKNLGRNFFLQKSQYGLMLYINSSNKLIERLITKSYMPIKMPEYTDDINYFQTGTIQTLEPFHYPVNLLAPSEMSLIQREKMKLGLDRDYYKKEPSFYQHKPYNYYVAVLKEYFSEDYANLELRYLPENL